MTNLRKQLLYLRQVLPDSDALLHMDRQSVQWDATTPVQVDVEAFRSALAAAAHAPDSQAISGLRQALAMYAGELLPGCYEEWLLPLREGGGMGWLRRKYGLACNNLISADIITADGQFRHLSATENSDLFWGIRGGGGNFGIVTSFEYQLHPVGPLVMMATTMYAMSDAKQVLYTWHDFMQDAPDEVTSVAFFWNVPKIDPIPSNLWGTPILGISAMYASTAEEGERILQPLRQLAESLPIDHVARVDTAT